MKIYQLHKYGGQWEDSYDHIIGSYLRKERAEEEKSKAEANEKELMERADKCENCPLLVEAWDNMNDLLSKYSDYCDVMKLEESSYGIDCENYYSHWDNNVTFEIKEVEVEE